MINRKTSIDIPNYGLYSFSRIEDDLYGFGWRGQITKSQGNYVRQIKLALESEISHIDDAESVRHIQNLIADCEKLLSTAKSTNWLQ